MRNVTKVLVVLAVVFCLAAASPAFADTFAWSYSGGTGSDTGGSGQITTTGFSGSTATITGVSGTWDGVAISALLPTGTCCSSPANDNVLYLPPSPGYLDLGGLGLAFQAGATDVNIYFVGPGQSGGYNVLSVASSMAPPGGPAPAGTLTSVGGTFAITPEPMTLGLLGSGLAGLFLASKKRT
jgi:hypothetical protein